MVLEREHGTKIDGRSVIGGILLLAGMTILVFSAIALFALLDWQVHDYGSPYISGRTLRISGRILLGGLAPIAEFVLPIVVAHVLLALGIMIWFYPRD